MSEDDFKYKIVCRECGDRVGCSATLTAQPFNFKCKKCLYIKAECKDAYERGYKHAIQHRINKLEKEKKYGSEN